MTTVPCREGSAIKKLAFYAPSCAVSPAAVESLLLARISAIKKMESCCKQPPCGSWTCIDDSKDSPVTETLRRGHCLARAAAGNSSCMVTAAVLANTLGYYGQFRPRVAEALAAGLAPLEKQLQVRMWLCLKSM